MRKKIYHAGVNDADYVIRKGSWICPFYMRWANMLQRCYSVNYQATRPTYKGCYVCEEWLTFSTFKSWMEKQSWQDLQMDKDIRAPAALKVRYLNIDKGE